MRPTTRLVFLASLLALGCQTPGLTPAGGPAAGPRMVRQAGAMALDPATDLAVRFTDGCPMEQPTYALRQVGPVAGSDVARIVVRIAGDAIAEPIVFEVRRADFNGTCQLTSQLYDLPVGDYVVTTNAFDAAGELLATGDGKAHVDKGTTRTIDVACEFSVVPVPIYISPTPTPLPSGLPSPTPTPTLPPTTPTPTYDACYMGTPPDFPANPVPDPATYFDRIHGLHADRNGRVYLFGLRKQPWPDAYDRATTVMVDRDGRLKEIFHRKQYAFYEGSLSQQANSCLVGIYAETLAPPSDNPNIDTDVPHSANRAAMSLNSGIQGPVWSRIFPGDVTAPWAANGDSPNGHYITWGSGDPAKLAAYAIADYFETGRVYMDRMALTGGRAAATERPLSLVADYIRKVPIWSSKQGIFRPVVPYGATQPPVRLLARPVYDMTKLPVETTWYKRNEVLFTTYTAGDAHVYHVDLDAPSPTPTIAYTFLQGIPHRIERGLDGNLYVLLAKGPLPMDPATDNDPYMHEFPGTREVRVVKLGYDPATHTLVNPRLVADSMVGTPASF